MKEELHKYIPSEFEKSIFEIWQKNDLFKANVDREKKPYVISMPPPNITGKLHLGHALDLTLQDILIRFKRMQGYEALWVPGEDHASIATEVRVENELLKDGIKKEELGREKFLEKVWQWTETYRKKIREQIETMGASCDFSREAFTMDNNLSKAVREVFVKLYNQGYIYQGNRITNWCPKCTTALSDAEIEYKEMEGKFWHIKYPLEDGSGYLEIATTRPETMLGDVAVMVHPEDERYKEYIGKYVVLPLVGKKIPVISDSYVDMEFATGVVKVTPAHDPNDYEVGIRHNLPQIKILDEKACINENGFEYEGLYRYDARQKIVEDLDKNGFLISVKSHIHNVSCHDRCGTIIEPMISKQWYVKMDELAKPAIECVKNKEVSFIPERFEKIYFNWMDNIKDWCISRQLWWGHRIPVFYCKDCNHITVSSCDVLKCEKCCSENIYQDEDVLDTWFSSALWPFSILGWPEETEDLKYFYPNETLVTGYDIIFFWVARMIFSGIHNMRQIPFKKVFIHGIIRDSQGRKMSKSLDNGVDPMDVIEKYGADALRFMLINGISPGNDIRYIEEKVDSASNFANKIWNASKFVMMNLDEDLIKKYENLDEYNLADKWILNKLNSLVFEVTNNFEKFELGVGLSKIYDFIWTEFCDWYIELSKTVLYGDDEKQKGITLRVLKKVLIDSLKLLHPIMPFITEKLYFNLKDNDEDFLVISKFPIYDESVDFKVCEEEMNLIIESIRMIRNLRSQMNIPPSKKAKLYIVPKDKFRNMYQESLVYIEKLGLAKEIEVIDEIDQELVNSNKVVSIVTSSSNMYIPVLDLVDVKKELDRLTKEEKKLEMEIDRLVKKLSNEGFVNKAPEKVIQDEKNKLKKYESMLEDVQKSILNFKNNLE